MIKKLNRRQFLKVASATAAGATFTRFDPRLLALAQSDLPFEIAAEAMNPLNVPDGTAAEGVFFEGGFGRAYIDFAADIFGKVHPGSSMSVEGIQRLGERLRPRFIAGEPPDVIDNSGAGALDTAALVAEGELLDLAPLFAAPALDTPGKTFGETLFPGSQASGVYGGVQYAVNIAYTVFGAWYSKTLFEEKGWVYPTTWDEMLALCETIKADGIAPWTYQGKYPYYVVFGLLEPLVHKIGGDAVWKKIDNLEAGAWEQPEVLQALQMLQQLQSNDYIMAGTEALSHTESQAEWLQNKAAFIPCGTWLENEMRSVTPEGFEMVVGSIPATDPEKAAWIGAEAGEPYMVPSAGKNPEAGMEFLRCLLSKESAKYFAKEVSAIMPVVGGTEGIEVSAATKSALDAVAASGNNIYARPFFGNWYSDLNTEVGNSTGALMTGQIGPEEFIERVQGVADEVKEDPDIVKYTR